MLNYLILGAGPAGLTFANRLWDLGERNFLVLESEKNAGGLCRSEIVDGSPLDIGGGHFLDVRRPNINNYLYNYMPKEEWNEYVRDSRIDINGLLIHHPIEANIWEMDIENQIIYLKSIASAGCIIGKNCPKKFVDWIYWKLGEKIADDYMLPYNQKMFGNELDNLGTYWLEKLPDVNFDETLRSCLLHKAFGKQPGHAQFLYPKKYGYGELWLRMASQISSKILFEQKVTSIDFQNKSVITQTQDKYEAKNIVTTIPWKSFNNFYGIPKKYINYISSLKHTSVQIEYFDNNMDTSAHWIYYPNLKLPYHRKLLRHNFCQDSKGYWTETNMDRIINNSSKNFKFNNTFAYPLNTINKNKIMNELLNWTAKHNIYGLGRWGEHQHYNSDLTVEKAIKLVEKIVCQ